MTTITKQTTFRTYLVKRYLNSMCGNFYYLRISNKALTVYTAVYWINCCIKILILKKSTWY